MNESFEARPNNKFKIETIEMPDGGSISYCPERGIITSIKIKGKELLYMDETTLFNKELKIRGGIPVLFPNAGEIPKGETESELSKLKSHGFARDEKWDLVETMEGINVSLRASKETREVYDYDFELSLINKFGNDGSLTIVQEVRSLEDNKEMPIAMWLHPYFRVSSEKKKEIRFNFPGGDLIEKDINNWENGGTIEIDNPKVPLEIFIPDLGTLVLSVSEEYKKICVWSQPGKDFVCIEPFMRSEGGIIKDPKMLKHMEKFSVSLNLNLKE